MSDPINSQRTSTALPNSHTPTLIQHYKKKDVDSNQNRRRQHLLQLQRERQSQFLKEHRNSILESIADLDFVEGNLQDPGTQIERGSLEVSDTLQEMSIKVFDGTSDQRDHTSANCSPTCRSPSANDNKAKLRPPRWMEPEPLIEIPEDLSSNWTAVPIPRDGRRCILSTKSCKTFCRFFDPQSGESRTETFLSLLPGGSPRSPGKRTVMDCFFHPPSSRIYLLDLLIWNGVLYHDSEFSFRRFWINSKTSDLATDQVSVCNTYPILPTPSFPATAESILSALNSPQLTNYQPSILFLFCNESSYVIGSTPLVCSLPLNSLATLLPGLQ